MAQNESYKVVILGEGCVGKTCILLRYVEDKFNDKHITTLQASFLTKKLNLDGKRVTLSIWDTAGQERFHALGPIYYRGSKGAILVYDITDEDSFRKVKNWVKELKQVLSDDIPLCIVGNKIDLEKTRQVSAQEAEEYATSVGAKHFHTSAKLNRGLNDLFLDLSRRMLANTEAEVGRSTLTDRRQSQRARVVVFDENSATQSRSKCC